MTTKEQIEAFRKSLHEHIDKAVDTLLFNLGEADTILDELNATNGQYAVSMIVEAPPTELPNLDGIAPIGQTDEKAALVEELKERMDLEQTGEPLQAPAATFQQDLSWELVPVDDERYTKYVTWVISKKVDRETLHGAQVKQELRFDPKAYDHLLNLIWYREELSKGTSGAFTLNQILSQNETTEAEKVLWKAFAKTIK